MADQPQDLLMGRMGGFGDLGAGLGGGIGAAIGQLLAAGDYEEAQRLYEQVAGVYEGIDPNAFNLGPTAFERVQGEMDPTTRLRQAQVLDELSKRWEQGGMDAGARADLAEGLGGAAQMARANQGAVLQNAAARGQSRSGATLAAQLGAGQQAATRANQAGLRASADAQARAYQALADSGGLAGQLHGQDYGEATDRASARDAIERFNRQNQTQQANLRAQGLAGAYSQQAGNKQAKGDRTVQTAYGIGSGLGRGAGMAGGWFLGRP
jgi:hypothetical protein